jgi:hypothetical protein
MCPFCLGLIAAGAASTGGLAALALKMSRKKNSAREINPDANERSSQNVNSNGR